VHIFCITDIHLSYEQAIFNCTAAPPHLHITRAIAAACTYRTASWADLLCLLLISVRTLCYRHLVTTVYTSRPVAAKILLQRWRHYSPHIPSQSVCVPWLWNYTARRWRMLWPTLTLQNVNALVSSILLCPYWYETLNVDFVRIVSCHIRRHCTCSACSYLQAVTLVWRLLYCNCMSAHFLSFRLSSYKSCGNAELLLNEL
jgi:hypothetical protein